MISVILCGGAGSRLWPVSRERHPKPFIRLSDGYSLVQKAFLHAAGLPQTGEILTLTNWSLHFKIEDEIKSLALAPKHSYILEPFGRNTAAAITAAALDAARRYSDETPMLILAADHLIRDTGAFSLAVEKAMPLIDQNRIVTFGITPAAPETGFGYIEADGSDVLRFIEKPQAEDALKYYRAGNFFWNAGIFCFKAGLLLAEMQKHAPELLKAVKDCFAASIAKAGGRRPEALELEAESFKNVQSISIDYALMEKSDKVSVIPCDMGWNDIGSWSALGEAEAPDAHGNHIMGPEPAVILNDVKNCDIHSDGRLVAALGLDNLLIVDTADALLVADKRKAQDVKEIYNQLKAENHETYKQHRTVHRPWGSFTVLELAPRFQVKRLHIKPGASISLQLHHHRSEHWVVVGGMAEVTCEDRVFFVDTNESTYIKAGHRHRVANRGIMPLVIIEVQSGDYLGEDDIVRFDDIYGRAEQAR